jgi:hypothetical protein
MNGCRIGKVTPKIQVVENFPYPVNQDAVNFLEHALEQAKAGEFRTIGIAAINARGYVTTAHSIAQGENPVLLSGAVNWLSQRVMDKVME